jgi:hypothetical protein
MKKKIDEIIDESKNLIGKCMNMDELPNDIEQLLLKYSCGTEVNELTVYEFGRLNTIIYDIIVNAKKIINED